MGKSKLIATLAVSLSYCAHARDIETLIQQLTLDEKIMMLAGDGKFDRPGVDRLQIPALRMTDGPMGIANATLIEAPKATAFPAGIALASTWNPATVSDVSSAIADEAVAMGKNMLLAPCINIQRAPQGGRNFESYSEDPALAAAMTDAFIRGVQSRGIIATAKHFALNNQETDRLVIDVIARPSVMDEIYFPAFRAAVNAGVGAIMSSYNKLNGTYASENPYLLSEKLNEWGFGGIVVSDWGATYKSAMLGAFRAGLNIEMPWAFVFSPVYVHEALAGNQITEADIDQKIRRQLVTMQSLGLLDRAAPAVTQNIPTPMLEDHRTVAFRAAVEGSVLLKNDANFLPLATDLHSIVVMGPNVKPIPHSGAGSAKVNPWVIPDAVDGISKEISPQTNLRYVTDGEFDSSKDVIQGADAVILYLGLNDVLEGEGRDRASLAIPDSQIALLSKVAALNANVVVVLNSGGMLITDPWIAKAKSVLQIWYDGQESAYSTAALLFGRENPSGKLPDSFLKREEDSWAHKNFPGDGTTVNYAEGIFVGYRYLEKKRILAAFPFGFGLSYSKFDLKMVGRKKTRTLVNFRLAVHNSSARDGAEVLQVYAASGIANRPVKELRTFKKVFVKAGTTEVVDFSIPREDAREILVGNSSQNISYRIKL